MGGIGGLVHGAENSISQVLSFVVVLRHSYEKLIHNEDIMQYFIFAISGTWVRTYRKWKYDWYFFAFF